MEEKEALGLRIVKLRKRAGLSRTELAEKMPAWCNEYTVVNLENGKRKLGLIEAIELAETLNVSLATLTAPIGMNADRKLGELTHRLEIAKDDAVRALKAYKRAEKALHEPNPFLSITENDRLLDLVMQDSRPLEYRDELRKTLERG